jgi:DUF2934 family protein
MTPDPDEVVAGPAAVPERDRAPEQFRMNRIAARAHEIYEARGGEHGKDMDDWLQAEREIDAEIAAAGGEAS